VSSVSGGEGGGEGSRGGGRDEKEEEEGYNNCDMLTFVSRGVEEFLTKSTGLL